MATEIELKLYCSPEEIVGIEAHPLIAAGTRLGGAKRLENTYFDTPDLALHRERIALRIRNTPSEQLQTVKCAAKSVAGLSSRPEWETRYTGAFDFRCVDVRKVREFLEERLSALVPVFTTTFERRTWRINVSKKISIMVMVDLGQVSSGDQIAPISEVELELAQGDPEDLLDFAIALASNAPLVPRDVSKAERGYQLFLNQETTPHKAVMSPLNAKQTSAEAFRQLATQGMQMWQANLLGTLTSNDQEFVHQFRVSLRRLNSLLKVYKAVLPESFQRQWTKRLKDLAQITGDLRDLDVMRSGVLQPMLLSESKITIEQVSTALAILDNARHTAEGNLQQLKYGAPVLLFAREIQELATDDFPKSLPRFASRQISGLYRNALKRLAKTLKSPTPGNAHRFRIALKHLRYACEYFAPLFDTEEMLQYARAIAGLQDEFGFINDFHVALSRLDGWVKDGVVQNESREAVISWHTARAQEVLGSALHLAENVMSRCQPWCTECESRGLSSIRRRLHHEIVLEIK